MALAKMPARGVVRISSDQKAMRVPRKRIEELISFAAGRERVGQWDIDVAVVGSRTMAKLNRQYLSRAGSTDVISFDLSTFPHDSLCGQLIVCADVALREARARSIGPQRELLLYVLHGLLHLIGYDDMSSEDAAKMSQRQEQLLDEFLSGGTRR